MIHANALWMLYTLGKALLSAGIFLRLKRGYERLYYSDYGNCGDRDIKDSDFWRITLINTYTSFHVSCKSISIRDSACLSFVTIFSRWNTRLSWKRDDENPYIVSKRGKKGWTTRRVINFRGRYFWNRRFNCLGRYNSPAKQWFTHTLKISGYTHTREMRVSCGP